MTKYPPFDHSESDSEKEIKRVAKKIDDMRKKQEKAETKEEKKKNGNS